MYSLRHLRDGSAVDPEVTKAQPSNMITPAVRRGLAAKALIPVNFLCLAPDAVRVAVVGDFNAWNPGSHPLERAFDGSWQATVPLRHGHHQYAFWVDGELRVDPRGQGVSRNARGERVSLLAVS
jgi:1,4-alpha-glucan branching enzyme